MQAQSMVQACGLQYMSMVQVILTCHVITVSFIIY